MPRQFLTMRKFKPFTCGTTDLPTNKDLEMIGLDAVNASDFPVMTYVNRIPSSGTESGTVFDDHGSFPAKAIREGQRDQSPR